MPGGFLPPTRSRRRRHTRRQPCAPECANIEEKRRACNSFLSPTVADGVFSYVSSASPSRAEGRGAHEEPLGRTVKPLRCGMLLQRCYAVTGPWLSPTGVVVMRSLITHMSSLSSCIYWNPYQLLFTSFTRHKCV